jgi:phospholipid transport system transporter-binding protein
VSKGGFEVVGEGRFRVSGDLGFATVPALWKASRSPLESAVEPRVDLGAVTNVDSAGLALLIEWMRWARAAGTAIVFSNVPAKLAALATMSELDELFPEKPSGA